MATINNFDVEELFVKQNRHPKVMCHENKVKNDNAFLYHLYNKIFIYLNFLCFCFCLLPSVFGNLNS